MFKIAFMITLIDLVIMLFLRKTTGVELTVVNIIRAYIAL